MVEPNHGPLLDTMRITEGHLPPHLIHPRVEPEIAFVLGEDLRPGDVVITGGLTAAVRLDAGDVVVADFGDGAATVGLRGA